MLKNEQATENTVSDLHIQCPLWRERHFRDNLEKIRTVL